MKPISTKLTADIKYGLILDRLPLYNWSVPEAAISIGYSRSYAERRLDKLLKSNVRFCAELDKRKAAIQVKTDVSIDQIVQELKNIAFSTDEKGGYLNPLNSRLKALELLGKYKAMFADRQIIETPDVQIDHTKREQAKRLSVLLLQAESVSHE